MDKKIKYIRNNIFVTKKVNNKWIILENDKNHYYELNEIGGFIWQSLIQPKTIPQIVAEIRENYSVLEDKARVDVENFIEQYRKKGFIKKIP